jgi:hypothetical protein
VRGWQQVVYPEPDAQCDRMLAEDREFFLTVRPNATAVVRTALAGTSVELVASCAVEAYDALAPEAFRADALMPGARGLVVAGSAGPALWRQLRAKMGADSAKWDEPDPLDRFVAAILTQADAALAAKGIRFRRFDAAFHAALRLDFIAMGCLVGLGSRGPFGMLIHAEHGAWWALRGVWLVDARVDDPSDHCPPCAGCPAPCVGGSIHAGEGAGARGIAEFATPDARARCVVGQQSRYDDDQIAYHYDRVATVARLKGT